MRTNDWICFCGLLQLKQRPIYLKREICRPNYDHFHDFQVSQLLRFEVFCLFVENAFCGRSLACCSYVYFMYFSFGLLCSWRTFVLRFWMTDLKKFFPILFFKIIFLLFFFQLDYWIVTKVAPTTRYNDDVNACLVKKNSASFSLFVSELALFTSSINLH